MSLTLATPRLLINYEPDVDTFDWVGGGRCGVYYLWRDAECAGAISMTSLSRSNGEIGYEMEPEFRGQGLATEALIAVAASAERHHGFSLLFAQALSDNAASLRVLEKAGFEPCGAKLKWASDRAAPAGIVHFRRFADGGRR